MEGFIITLPVLALRLRLYVWFTNISLALDCLTHGKISVHSLRRWMYRCHYKLIKMVNVVAR